MIARAPLGLLDFLDACVREIAVLVAWGRETGGGPVAVGGISLGALTAQRAAVAASDWPESARPDALLLVGTSDSIGAVADDGSLTRLLGLPEALAAHGWTYEATAPWLPLMDPVGAPAVPPDRTVMALGRADDVTPFARGMELARRWRVPEANLFVRRRGHFSLALGLFRDDAPLGRLAELLKSVR